MDSRMDLVSMILVKTLDLNKLREFRSGLIQMLSQTQIDSRATGVKLEHTSWVESGSTDAESTKILSRDQMRSIVTSLRYRRHDQPRSKLMRWGSRIQVYPRGEI